MLKLLPVRLRNAEHIRDHNHRQGMGQVLNHIHATGWHDGIEVSLDNLLNAPLQRGDGAGRKRLAHEPAQPRVIGRILTQH